MLDGSKALFFFPNVVGHPAMHRTTSIRRVVRIHHSELGPMGRVMVSAGHRWHVFRHSRDNNFAIQWLGGSGSELGLFIFPNGERFGARVSQPSDSFGNAFIFNHHILAVLLIFV